MSATETPAAAPAPAFVNGTKEAELNGKIKALQERVAAIQREIKIAQGRIANADPRVVDHLKRENEKLGMRVKEMQTALLSVLLSTTRARQSKDANIQAEALVKATIDYCKKFKVDEQIWKSLES